MQTTIAQGNHRIDTYTQRRFHRRSTGLSATRAAAGCKQLFMPGVAIMFLLVAAGLAAPGCGGSAKKDHYQTAIDKQEACCRNLSDPGAQASCMDGIVRVDDPEVQMSQLNQASFSCFTRHFECDASTGTVTREASQKQYDCISDLKQ